MDTAFPPKIPFILDRNLAKANCTEDRVCTSCDKVVLDFRSITFIFLWFAGHRSACRDARAVMERWTARTGVTSERVTAFCGFFQWNSLYCAMTSSTARMVEMRLSAVSYFGDDCMRNVENNDIWKAILINL